MTATQSLVWDDPRFWSEAAEQAYAKARRRAVREVLLGKLRGRSPSLRSFEDLRARRHLLPQPQRRLKTVPLSQIVGSVNKPRHFTRSFGPTMRQMRGRWKRAYTVARGHTGFRPIELYGVDDEYYVVDGHFRVSVAHALGGDSIDAVVREWS